jgi:formate hydrogenlyase transcriptional activator
MATSNLYVRLQSGVHDLFGEPEQLLAGFFTSSVVGLSVLDRDLRFVLVNPTLARMNGLSTQGHLGKPLREVLGAFAGSVEPLMRHVLLTGEPIVNLEISGKLPTRRQVGHWIENYFPIKNGKGEVTQVGAIVIEITRQKEAEKVKRFLFDNLQKKTDRLQTLQQIGAILVSELDLQKVFPQVAACIRLIIGQECSAVSLLSPSTRSVTMYAVDFPRAPELLICGETIPIEDTASGQAMVRRQAMVLSYTELVSIKSSFIHRFLKYGIKSAVCIPLATPRGAIGCLSLASKRENGFLQEDLEFLNTVAGLIALALDNSHAYQELTALKDKLFQEKLYLESGGPSEIASDEIIGKSPALTVTLALASRVAPSETTVLILGETGTGKGMVAKMIHRLSCRDKASFIHLNCAAIPTGLIESELFGHERGAFTGAISRRLGVLEVSDGGTLFLDEIGELPLELQPKLLRVLQDGEFERLGSTHTRRVNIRLIAATNRDLAKSVTEKDFRADLYYRLNVFPIRLPSLRDRTADIPLLVRHFVQKYTLKMNKSISRIPTATMDVLMAWRWPGNIRELENFIERSVILTEGSILQAPVAELLLEEEISGVDTLESTEREHIAHVLHETKGNISRAAVRLGLKRTTLQSMIHRLGISLPGKRGPGV